MPSLREVRGPLNSASRVGLSWVGDGILHHDGTSWSAVASGIATNLYGVWGSDAANVWAVGQAGQILRYDGQRWSAQGSSLPATMDLLSVSGISDKRVYAVGRNNGLGVLYTWDGTSWVDTAIPAGTGSLNGVFALDATHAWAVGASGAVLTWNGSSWASSTQATENLYGVWAADASNVWVVGELGRTLYWNGSNWTQLALSPLLPVYAVFSQGKNYRVAVGAEGIIYADGAAGSQWSLTTDSLPGFSAIWGSSSDNLWAVGSTATGKAQLAHRDGSGWSNPVSGFTNNLLAVHGTASNDIWAVGYSNNVLHYDGTRWSYASLDPSIVGVNFTGVWAVNRNLAFATAEGTSVYRWDGVKWTALAFVFPSRMLGVWAADANNVVVVGGGGSAYMSSDGGANWQKGNTGIAVTDSLQSVFGTSMSDIWGVGDNGVASHFNGSVWQSVPTCTKLQLRSVFGKTPQRYVAAGNSGVICVYDGQSWTLERAKTGAPLSGVFGTDANNTWIVGSVGHILRQQR